MGIAIIHRISVKIACEFLVHGEGFLVTPYLDKEHPCTKSESVSTPWLKLSTRFTVTLKTFLHQS